jgi:acyl carrier protein
MNSPTFDAISQVLVARFQVEPSRVHAGATLESLGLDSLALMEFVFAAEDRFEVRIPEEKLDPRQAGITLDRLADLIDEARSSSPGAKAA